MAKFKTLIEKPASKSSLKVQLDADVNALQDEVKQLLKDTGSKMNLDRTLQPILRDILQDAKHQLIETKEEQQLFAQETVQAAKKEVDLEPA